MRSGSAVQAATLRANPLAQMHPGNSRECSVNKQGDIYAESDLTIIREDLFRIKKQQRGWLANLLVRLCE